MSGFFHELGKLAGDKFRRANWLFSALTGTDAQAIEAEFEMGRMLAESVEREFPVDPDPTAQQLVNELSERLVDRLKNKQRRFRFGVLQLPDPNAFALPGGFIWVHRPLLEVCEWDRDEVAWVLGHEMGHVIRRHALERLAASKLIRGAMTVVSPAGLLAGHLRGIVGELLCSGYSQDQELDADEFGLRLALAAGFDGGGALGALTRFRKLEGVAPVISSYLSSHPPAALRCGRLQQHLRGSA